MLETIRIYGSDKNRHDEPTCNVVMTYELVEYGASDAHWGAESYAVLHRVQIEPTVDSTLLLDCPLHDDDAREHFEQLLSANLHGYRVGLAVSAQQLAKSYLEVA